MKKILIVDDEPDVLETIEFCLEQEGYEVITANNGLEGLGAVRVHHPDLAILDVMMPGENGYRVAAMIRGDEKSGEKAGHLPIILLTARDLSGDPEREKLFMDFSGADLMLYKPFEIRELLERVDGLLQSHDGAAGEAAAASPEAAASSG